MLPQGQPEVPLAQRPFVDIEAVSPGWFDVMRVPLRGGRAFNSADQPQSAPVVIVNESFARQYWPNANPLDQHVVVGRRPVPAQVVGVAADVKNKGLEADTQPQLYLPFPQLPWENMVLIVRTDGSPQSVISAVRAQIAAVDPDQPLTEVQTVEDLMDTARAQPRFLLALVGAFAGLALVLAVIGIYGVLSFSVAQRRQEFGVRMAMGADRAHILGVVLRQGFVLALTGVCLGLVAALLLVKLDGQHALQDGRTRPGDVYRRAAGAGGGGAAGELSAGAPSHQSEPDRRAAIEGARYRSCSAIRIRLIAHTMKDSIHVSKENYLKAILEAEAEGRQVIPATLVALA